MRTLILMLAAALASAVQAAPQEAVWALAQKEKPAAIETLRELVNIESGSRDKEGLDRLAANLGERLAGLSAKVEFYEPSAADHYRLFDTPKEIGKGGGGPAPSTTSSSPASRAWRRRRARSRWRRAASARRR